MKTCPQCHATHPDDLAVCPSDGTPLVEPAAWPEGTVIKGKYRILAKIGQDVICTYYKALWLEVRAILLPECDELGFSR